MGVDALRKAFDAIDAAPDRCDVLGPRDEGLVCAAEQELGVRLPPSYRHFVSRLGVASIGAEEIYGVVRSDFANSGVPDAIWMTLRARTEWGLPEPMVVVYFDGAESYFVLDGRVHEADDEWPVVVWRPGISTSDEVLEHVASDFASLLLRIVEDQLVRP